MPLYDYDCAACGARFEVIHGVHGEGPARCPQCGGGPVRKAFAAPAIHFKGSGWAKKERRAAVTSAAKTGAGEPSSPTAGGDTSPTGSTDGETSTTKAASDGKAASTSTAATTAD